MALRVAVIGLGKMGLLHTCILKVLPQVRIVAVCDKSRLIRTISSRLLGGVELTSDMEKLAGLDLDAAYITTPIPSHYAVAKTLLSEKIAQNLFVEKTLASSYKEANELCGLSRSFGHIDMVGYMKRFAVTFRKAKQLLDQEILGDLISFDAHAYSSDFADSRKGSREAGMRGDVLGDLGSHVVDLALWFFGSLEVASAEFESMNPFGPEDSLKFQVRNLMVCREGLVSLGV